jgi:hypothetical protein
VSEWSQLQALLMVVPEYKKTVFLYSSLYVVHVPSTDSGILLVLP